MEESWRGADHTQTSWGAADRCHESTAVIGTARMEGRTKKRRGKERLGWEETRGEEKGGQRMLVQRRERRKRESGV